MNADLTDTLSHRQTEDGRGAVDLAEQLEPVLQEMIAGIRRHRETPLLAGFDSTGIVDAASQSLLASNPNVKLVHLQDWEAVKLVFNLLVVRAFEDDRDHAEDSLAVSPNGRGNDRLASAREQGNGKVAHPWAVWLEQLHTVMQEVHPKAIEIMGLRLDGYKNREIAKQLELTVRLVRRIVHDMQQAWADAMEGE